jgi:hypothetical protein
MVARSLMVGLCGLLLASPALADKDAKKEKDKKKPDVQVHGFVLWNGILDGDTMNNADVPLWVAANAPVAVTSTARQSRLIVTAKKAIDDDWTGDAKIEADFFGGFPASGVPETFPLFRLRIATVGVAGDGWRIQAGQDWVIFAPAIPETLSHQAVPGWAASGNLWARQPQLQATDTIDTGGDAKITLQAAVLAPITADAPTPNPFVVNDPIGAGSRAGTPAGEARAAVGYPLIGDATSTIGISGHVGRERYSLEGGGTTTITSWGAALDLSLALDRVSILGEAFIGRDLGAFMGGVWQGVAKGAPVTAGDPPSSVTGVRSRGGWLQAIVTIGHGFRAAIGGGIDDPVDDDLIAGMRSQNRSAYLTAFWRWEEVEVAAELEAFHTTTIGGPALQALSLNLGAIYRF